MSLTTILNGKRCYPKDNTIKNTLIGELADFLGDEVVNAIWN